MRRERPPVFTGHPRTWQPIDFSFDLSRPPVGADLLDSPMVSLLGPSTTHRNNAEATHILYNLTSGPDMWAKQLGAGIRILNYYNASDALGRNWSGDNYGLDSDPISNQHTRVATIKANNSRIFKYNSGRGAADVLAGQTVAGYCDGVKVDLLDVKSGGKRVIWENLWPRHTLVGGDWASGGAARQLVLDINAEMLTWCAANGILYADVWTVMVDQNDADKNPKAGYYSSDGIHYSSRGARMVGKYYKSLYDTLCNPPADFSAADAANRAPNGVLSGTGGALGNSATGVVPDSFTLTRSTGTNARSLVGSFETINGKSWYVMTVGSSGAIGSSGEGFSLRYTTTTVTNLLESSKWYVARLKVKLDTWAGWTGIKLLAQDAAATPNGCADNTPGTGVGGNVPLTGFTATDQYAITPDSSDDLILETQPFLAGTTTGTLRLNVTYISASGGGVLKIADLDLREVTNPSTLI